VSLDGLHEDRGRAEAFGGAAEQYDRYRPDYPPALVDDLVSLRPGAVLDVGCGTGKVAVALLRHGLPVLGVEPDGRMAALARQRGVPVEVATFERWEPAGRRFDLITCGQAWHWINPDEGLAQARRVLAPSGVLARFWNYHRFDDAVLQVLDAVYEELAPGVQGLGHDPTREAQPPDPFERDGDWSVEAVTYRWDRSCSAQDYAGLVATFSDHQRLGPVRLRALQQALHDAVQGLGGTLHSTGGTYVRLARPR
jgi:SAM-dependent methyltransferase